jgi:hypothetical protein
MLRGADKTMKDKTNKTPVDCIDEVGDADNRTELRKMLGDPSKFECLMLQPPNRLTHKNPTTIRIYITVFVVVYAIQFFFVFPRLPFYMLIVNSGLSLLVLILLTCVN